MRRVVAPCKPGIKPRARANSFSWARVKGTAKVNPINSTVMKVSWYEYHRYCIHRYMYMGIVHRNVGCSMVDHILYYYIDLVDLQ